MESHALLGEVKQPSYRPMPTDNHLFLITRGRPFEDRLRQLFLTPESFLIPKGMPDREFKS